MAVQRFRLQSLRDAALPERISLQSSQKTEQDEKYNQLLANVGRRSGALLVLAGRCQPVDTHLHRIARHPPSFATNIDSRVRRAIHLDWLNVFLHSPHSSPFLCQVRERYSASPIKTSNMALDSQPVPELPKGSAFESASVGTPSKSPSPYAIISKDCITNKLTGVLRGIKAASTNDPQKDQRGF
ncbi:hypothetical protein BDR22DRAFT_818343 [Usnea florida]